MPHVLLCTTLDQTFALLGDTEAADFILRSGRFDIDGAIVILTFVIYFFIFKSSIIASIKVIK